MSPAEIILAGVLAVAVSWRLLAGLVGWLTSEDVEREGF